MAPTHNFSVRLPEEVAREAQAVARVQGTSINALVTESLIEAIERRRSDPEFMSQVKRIIEEDREILERLAK